MGTARPRAGQVLRRRATAAFGAAGLAAVLGSCGAVRPTPVALQALPSPAEQPPPVVVQPQSRATYKSIVTPAELPFMWPPDSLLGDTMAVRHFQAGRLAGRVHLRGAGRRASPVAPPLPLALRPSPPASLARANAAYSLGFERQFTRDRATLGAGAETGIAGLGIAAGAVAIIAAILVTMTAVNDVAGAVFYRGSP